MYMYKKVNQPFFELESGMFYWKTKPVCFGCAAARPHGSCTPAAAPWLGYFMLEVLWQYVRAET